METILTTSKAIYAGSFDPFTKGHQDVVTSALKVFSKVEILVATNATKSRFVPLETMSDLIGELYKFEKKVTVSWSDAPQFTAEFARDNNAVLIRGIRSGQDLEQELILANFNLLNFDVQTFFVHCPGSIGISSSIVKQMVGLPGWQGLLQTYVPENIEHYLRTSF